jgi:hypothetical protein
LVDQEDRLRRPRAGTKKAAGNRRPPPRLVDPFAGDEGRRIALLLAQSRKGALSQGAARPILDAYRRARHARDGELTAFNAACEVAKAMGRPTDELRVTVRTLLEWARARLPSSPATGPM